MTTDELLELLDESQQLLNEATNIEDQKRVRIRRESLKAELAKCSHAALHAHGQASGQLQALELIIEQAKDGVEAIRPAATGNGMRQADNRIYEQLAEAVADMLEAHQTALKDNEDNRQRLGTFNITLFGRTMTGKSTLMEILTEGDGHTISKGAQRTTRDTRQYEWNGMKILDVPGVAAFGGSDDERVAYQAAQQADLILFLITDDAPQPAEAEHFAKLRRTGNPMLGICNVKLAVNGELGLRRFLKSQQNLFDQDTLDGIVSQFQEMHSRLGPGQHVEFKHAHLLSRFLADRPEYRDQRVKLYAASRFADIEDHIYREVTDNGSFHRQRSFLESTSRASFDIWRQMLIAGTTTWELHDRIQDHVKETRAWAGEFRKDANAGIQALLNSTIGRLRAAIPAFVEANCEDKDLAEKWARRVQSAGINRRVQELQEDLHQRIVDKVNTLIQELDQELQSVQATIIQPDLITGPIADHRKRWNWGTIGITSALGIATTISAFTFPPLAIPLALGIATAVVGIIGRIIGRFLGNKAERRQEAITRITPELHKHLDQIESDLKRQLNRWFRNDLIEQQVNTAIAQLASAATGMEQAARFYQAQAASLNQQLLNENQQLLRTALEHIGEDTGVTEHIVTARVPGQGIVIKTGLGAKLPQTTIDRLQVVLQEPITAVPDRWSTKQTIRWGTGGSTTPNDIRIDRERATARVAHDVQDPSTATRISMAQQFTGLHIRNSN